MGADIPLIAHVLQSSCLLALFGCVANGGDAAPTEVDARANLDGGAPRKQLSAQSGGASRWLTINACKTSCTDQVSGADGVPATKSAFCEASCACFADLQLDADGKPKKASRAETQSALASCQSQTAERLGWSPTPQEQNAAGDAGPADAPPARSASATEVADRKTAESMCNQGCTTSVAAASGTQEIKRKYCQKTCTCLADVTFDAQGHPRPTKVPVPTLIETCMKKTIAALRWSPNPADL